MVSITFGQKVHFLPWREGRCDRWVATSKVITATLPFLVAQSHCLWLTLQHMEFIWSGALVISVPCAWGTQFPDLCITGLLSQFSPQLKYLHMTVAPVGNSCPSPSIIAPYFHTITHFTSNDLDLKV